MCSNTTRCDAAAHDAVSDLPFPLQTLVLTPCVHRYGEPRYYAPLYARVYSLTVSRTRSPALAPARAAAACVENEDPRSGGEARTDGLGLTGAAMSLALPAPGPYALRGALAGRLARAIFSQTARAAELHMYTNTDDGESCHSWTGASFNRRPHEDLKKARLQQKSLINTNANPHRSPSPGARARREGRHRTASASRERGTRPGAGHRAMDRLVATADSARNMLEVQ